MAVVDANYLFTYAHIGAFGQEGDSGVFSRSSFGKALYDSTGNGWKQLKLPDLHYLNGDLPCPYVFMADDAFALSKLLMYVCTRDNRAVL